MEGNYRNILEQLNEGIYYVDLNKRITLWNKAAERITGFSSEEVLGKCCADNILQHIDENGNKLCIVGCPLGKTLKDGGNRESQIYLHHKNGYRVPVNVRVTAIYDDDNQISGAVELFTDITNRLDMIKELEKLQKEILTDEMTQIGNRKYADQTLRRRMLEWKEMQVPFALIFIDIDHFKSVNDTYGHNVGDEALKMVANSISAAMRPFDVACRWGGEEFVVIVPNISSDSLDNIGERIRMLIENSWLTLETKKIAVTASLGCAIVNIEDDIDSLIQRADKAMYESKSSGRNKVTVA